MTLFVSVASTWIPKRVARSEIPRNSVPNSVPIAMSTIEALRAAGSRNAGTPFATASVPERPTEPEENARRTRNALSASFAATAWGAGTACGMSPARRR